MPSEKLLSFKDIMSKVGEFIFHWSLLEIQLAEILTAKGRSIEGGLTERLERWSECVPIHMQSELDEIRAQTLLIRDTRNVIVHGLNGGCSAGGPDQSHIICLLGGHKSPGEGQISITMTDLEDLCQATDACRRAFINPDYFNYRLSKDWSLAPR